MKKLLAIIFALSCSFFLNACSVSYTNYEEAAIELTEAMYTGKSKKVKNMIYFSKEDLAEPGLKEMIGGKMESVVHDSKVNAERRGGLKEIRVLESEVNDSGDRAKVSVLIKFNNGPDSNTQEDYTLEDYTFIKDGSSWKLFLD